MNKSTKRAEINCLICELIGLKLKAEVTKDIILFTVIALEMQNKIFRIQIVASQPIIRNFNKGCIDIAGKITGNECIILGNREIINLKQEAQ